VYLFDFFFLIAVLERLKRTNMKTEQLTKNGF